MADVAERISWEAERSDDGHRDYTVQFRVWMDSFNDGPQRATFASGLPNVGDSWGYGNDNDAWAFCTPYIKITPQVKDEKNRHWFLTYKFSTRPWSETSSGGGATRGGRARLSFCSGGAIENPLLEPDTIRGSYLSRTKRLEEDIDGRPVHLTSFEPIDIDVDANVPTVEIGQNVSDLGLGTFVNMWNTVNDSELWGLEVGRIKLSHTTWERRLYGVCNVYFTRTHVFEISDDPVGGWQFISVPNKCTKMLSGAWSADGTEFFIDGLDPDLATSYIEAVDHKGNPTQYYLERDGASKGVPTDDFVDLVFKTYDSSNFLQLGIPTTIP